MKKKSVINLIKYHSEHNEPAFRTEAYGIAHDFDAAGDYQLAEYIMALMSDAHTFVPQGNVDEFKSDYLRKLTQASIPLPLPDLISCDVKGILNAIGNNTGVNKFIFQGPPGTGKTETAKHIARILERDLYVADFSCVIDSKLGQTSKNIVELFKDIRAFPNQDGIVVLFDEIDALALDRADSHDIREMGRATSTFLRELENVSSQVVVIATTNLFSKLDRAIVRRFDASIDFGRYSRDDLIEVAEKIANAHISKFSFVSKNNRLLLKILQQVEVIPYPGDLSNIIKTSIAFSNPDDEYNYLQRLYRELVDCPISDVKNLQEQGFTMREIEILTGVPKSTVAREVKETL